MAHNMLCAIFANHNSLCGIGWERTGIMFTTIIKRDGRAVAYDRKKIEIAIQKAMEAGGRKNDGQAEKLAELAEGKLAEKFIVETRA